MSELLVLDLGLREYAEALSFQRDLAAARLAGRVAHDVLVLVEHPPVITLGRSSKAAHLLASPEALAARGVALHEVERGGDVTFHGPGQLVGYPIVDLTGHKQDLHWYLRQVEEVLIQAVGALGVPAERNPGKTGVWTGGRKLASIGVHARQWVTWHGCALNVTTDLRYFDLMVPCGIADVEMTSVAAALRQGATTGAARDAAPDDESTAAWAATLAASTRDAVIDAFGTLFSRTPRRVTQIAI
ncbi:MAG: lipoyl(octanoyl) transferase LipB [Gemmatimonadota bacterium]